METNKSKSKVYYLYCVHLVNTRYHYIGVTDNLERRISTHVNKINEALSSFSTNAKIRNVNNKYILFLNKKTSRISVAKRRREIFWRKEQPRSCCKGRT